MVLLTQKDSGRLFIQVLLKNKVAIEQLNTKGTSDIPLVPFNFIVIFNSLV